MATFMIGYDLHEGEDYDALEQAIENIDGASWHCLDPTWLINSDLTASEICNRLRPHLVNPDDSNGDRLLVVKLRGQWACTGAFSRECKAWLKNNISSA